MSGRAPEKELGELHGKLAGELSELIENGSQEVVRGKGDTPDELVRIPCPASVLNVARQFLKDNHIETIPGSGGRFDKLIGDLNDLDEDV